MGLAGQFVSAVGAVEGAAGMRLAYGIVAMPVALGSLAMTFRGEFVLSGSFPVELMHHAIYEHDGGQISTRGVFEVVADVLKRSV